MDKPEAEEGLGLPSCGAPERLAAPPRDTLAVDAGTTRKRPLSPASREGKHGPAQRLAGAGGGALALSGSQPEHGPAQRLAGAGGGALALGGSQRVIVLDLETTGRLPHQNDSILSIHAIEVVGLERTGRAFSQLVGRDGPGLPRSCSSLEEQGQALQIHGLSEDKLAGAPPIAEVIPALLDFIAGDTIIAFCAGCDVGFILAAALRLGCDMRSRWICLMVEAAALLQGGTFISLKSACQKLRIPLDEKRHHTAEYDATLAYLIWRKLYGYGRCMHAGCADPNKYVEKVRGSAEEERSRRMAELAQAKEEKKVE